MTDSNEFDKTGNMYVQVHFKEHRVRVYLFSSSFFVVSIFMSKGNDHNRSHVPPQLSSSLDLEYCACSVFPVVFLTALAHRIDMSPLLLFPSIQPLMISIIKLSDLPMIVCPKNLTHCMQMVESLVLIMNSFRIDPFLWCSVDDIRSIPRQASHFECTFLLMSSDFYSPGLWSTHEYREDN